MPCVLLLCIATLSACGDEAPRSGPPAPSSGSPLPTLTDVTHAPGEPDGVAGAGAGEPTPGAGLLELTARSSFKRGLGSLHYEVRDRFGKVMTTGYNEASAVGDADRKLLLQLPAGTGYELSLSSTTGGKRPVTCTASLGPLAVEVESPASYQVFVWQCEGEPPGASDDCYWLADWVGAARTDAAIGDEIAVSASAHDARGNPARLTWSTPAASMGRFSDETSPETRFRCRGRAAKVPLKVTMTDGTCTREVTQPVNCR